MRFRKIEAEALWHLQKIWNPSKALFLPECDFLPRVDIWLLQDGPPDDAVRHTEGLFLGVLAGFRVFSSKAYRSGWLGVRIAGHLATARAEIGAGEGTGAGDEESRPSGYRKTSP